MEKRQEQGGYSIRIAEHRDVDEILSLLKRVARWLHIQGIQQWESVIRGEDDHEIEKSVFNRQTYVVMNFDEIIATFIIYPEASDWDLKLWKTDAKQTAYLHKLALDWKELGKGLGSQVIGWVEQECRKKGTCRLRLDCVADNDKLNRFYSSNGYEKVGEVEGFSLYEKLLVQR